MWSYRIVAPYRFERTSIAEKTPDSLAEGQVLLRFLAAGVCGSDMPAFRGVRGVLLDDDGRSGPEKDGFSVHEIAGEVLASRHDRHRPGDRVVDKPALARIARASVHDSWHLLLCIFRHFGVVRAVAASVRKRMRTAKSPAGCGGEKSCPAFSKPQKQDREPDLESGAGRGARETSAAEEISRRRRG